PQSRSPSPTLFRSLHGVACPGVGAVDVARAAGIGGAVVGRLRGAARCERNGKEEGWDCAGREVRTSHDEASLRLGSRWADTTGGRLTAYSASPWHSGH